MIEFTKEEMILCEQLANRHRKDLKIGMYVWREFDKTIRLIYKLDEKEKDIYTVYTSVILKTEIFEKLFWNNLEGGWLTPLWTISDCIFWLREKGFYLSINTLGEYWTCLAYKNIFDEENKNIGPRIFFQEKTLFSALLKIVLAVLGEAK